MACQGAKRVWKERLERHLDVHRKAGRAIQPERPDGLVQPGQPLLERQFRQ